MVKEEENSIRGERQAPRSLSAPRVGLPGVLFLPGGFPNKVREGKVPVIIQPRFHGILVPLQLRPPGAGAGPLHDPRLASLQLVCAVFHPSWGPSLGGARLCPETLPLRLAPVRLAFGEAAPAPGQPLAAPRLSWSSPLPGVAGGAGAAAARPPWGPAESGSRSLSGPQIPRRRRRQLASSPEAKWPRLEGGHAAAGVRCVLSGFQGSAQR